jgi:hypothetical protein
MAYSYYYQFYAGKATYLPEYKERFNKIQNELISAKKAYSEIINKNNGVAANNGELNTNFLSGLKKEIAASLKEESILYNAVGLSAPTYDIDNIDSFLSESKQKISELTNHFVNTDNKGLFDFLAGLNDSRILNSLAGFMTTLSFTKRGEGSRSKGKALLTGSVNRALGKRGSQYNRYKEIMEYIWNDFFANDEVIELLESWNDENSIYKNITKESFVSSEPIFEIITNALDSQFGVISSKGLRSKNNSARSKSLNTSTGETKIKRFYKKVWTDLCAQFNVNSADRLSKVQQKVGFLGGSLKLETNIRSSTYGEKVLMTLYQKEEGVEKANKRITNGQVVKAFIEALESAYAAVPDYVDALDFIKQNTRLLKNYILSSYGLKEKAAAANDNSAKSIFALFSKSSISGLLGEIGAAIAFRSSSSALLSYDAIITGSEKDTSGKKIATDVKLEVRKIGKNGRVYNPKILNIQVKNYTTQRNNIQLYSGTELSIGSMDLSRYTFKGSKNFTKVLNFLIANQEIMSYFGVNGFTKEELSEGFNLFIDTFLRSASQSLEGELSSITRNAFYYINNRIVPASYILATAYQQAWELKQQNKQLFSLEGIFPNVEHINMEDPTRNYLPIDTNLQPRARKGGVGYKKNKAGRNQHYPIRAYSFELGSERFPREINENLVAGLKVKFKGITVKF